MLALGGAVLGGLVVGGGLSTSGEGPGSSYTPTFLRFDFSGDTAEYGSDRWQWQGLQGDRPRPAGVRQAFVYATAVQRPGDGLGVTQCVPPGGVKDSWFLRDRSGEKIFRSINGGDYALDVGNVEFRKSAGAFLLDKCARQGWDGVIHDEVNGELEWAFPGALSEKYPDPAAYRQVQLEYVSELGDTLRSGGFQLAGNIGQPIYETWCKDLSRTGMITSTEVFVAGDEGSSGMATADDGTWKERVEFTEWSMLHTQQVLVHDRATDPASIAYGLCSFLLVDNGRGAYGADLAYSAPTPYPVSFNDAVRLGPPVGARSEVETNLWRREFSRGYVLVNSGTVRAAHQGDVLSPTSGAIILN